MLLGGFWNIRIIIMTMNAATISWVSESGILWQAQIGPSTLKMHPGCLLGNKIMNCITEDLHSWLLGVNKSIFVKNYSRSTIQPRVFIESRITSFILKNRHRGLPSKNHFIGLEKNRWSVLSYWDDGSVQKNCNLWLPRVSFVSM